MMKNRISSSDKKRLIVSAGLLAVTGLLMLLFKHFSSALFPGYRRFSKALMGALAWLTGFIPIAIWDIGEVLLILLLIFSIVFTIVKKRRFFSWLSKTLLVVCAALCFVVNGWMLNHYGPSLAEELGMEITTYTQDELYEAAAYYLEQAAVYAPQMEREADGTLKEQDFYELAEIAGGSYQELGETYEIFDGSTVRVKRLWLTGKWMLMKGFTGEFMPLTGEASVPAEVPVLDQPFTMCHEAAHRLGLAAEEEANFAAYLACESSSDLRFRYSGYYSAYVYCYNALYKQDQNAAKALKEAHTGDAYELVYQDSRDVADYYQQFESKVSEAGNKLNDTYLKTFSEEAGSRSYGQVVDLFICWYRQK